MNSPLLLAVILMAAPVAASAESHTVVIRVSKGKKVYTHTANLFVQTHENYKGGEEHFRGKSDGQDTIFGTVLIEKKKLLELSLALEVSPFDRSSSYQAQVSLQVEPGYRARAIQCGDWTVDVSFDADAPNGAAPLWKADGPNYRVTAVSGKRRCQVIQNAETSNLVEHPRGARSYLQFHAHMTPTATGARVEYDIEDTALKAKGTEALVFGRKASARGGKLELLLEGSAPAPVAAAPAAAPSGGVPLLR
jgi:hypothetical protein